MKEVDSAMPYDEDKANDTRYASLTAGLLARKGEAVPAAAAFTAEAIAAIGNIFQRAGLLRKPSAF